MSNLNPSKKASLAIISGGSKGLGAALCEQYLARGFEVVEFSRSAAHAYSVAIDLALPEQVGATMSHALQPLSKRDWQSIVVISNAATVMPIGGVSKQQNAEVITSLNINVVSNIIFMSAVLAHFQSHHGQKTLASISSGVAQSARAGISLYCAAKAGIEHFMRAVAKEQDLEPHPFKMLNIDPGIIDTQMQTTLRQANSDDFPTLQQFIQRKKAGLLMRPETVAKRIVQIIDTPTLNNGQRIRVDMDE